jgi:hypothetical protein
MSCPLGAFGHIELTIGPGAIHRKEKCQKDNADEYHHSSRLTNCTKRIVEEEHNGRYDDNSESKDNPESITNGSEDQSGRTIATPNADPANEQKPTKGHRYGVTLGTRHMID